MRKTVLMLLAIGIMAVTVNGQSNSDSTDYQSSYDGIFVGGGLNTPETFTSPFAFNSLGYSNISYLSSGYEWNSHLRKWSGYNWWFTRTRATNVAILLDVFNTNEYQASIKANYSAKFAHDLISVGGNFESGVYSSFKDSVMKSYFYGGVEGSVFCVYGSIGLIYSKDLPFESLYNFTKDFIPIYEFGLKSPSLKISHKLLLNVKAVYCNYAIYQPKVYRYDNSGKIVENVIKDTDVFKGSVSILDHYGNVLQVGVSTWDMKNFQVGFSTKVNLRNIYRRE